MYPAVLADDGLTRDACDLARGEPIGEVLEAREDDVGHDRVRLGSVAFNKDMTLTQWIERH